MAGLDFDRIPHLERIAEPDGRASPWFAGLWQRLTDHIARRHCYGVGGYAASGGLVEIAHGLPKAPRLETCSVQPVAETAVVATLVETTPMAIRARLFVSSTGAAVSDGDHVLVWRCERP